MQNVSLIATLVWQLLFLHSLPDNKFESSFEWKVDFWLHWIVSAYLTPIYTLKTCILAFKFGQFHMSSFSLEVFYALVSVRPDNFSPQIGQKNKQIRLQMWFKCLNFAWLCTSYIWEGQRNISEPKKCNLGPVMTK